MSTSTAASALDREEERLAALHAYAILDTDREPEFDDIVAVAARACGTPIAHINFLDRDRQWFKAEIGIGCRELPAEPSLCARTMGEDEILLLPDVALDPENADVAHHLGGLPLRFYAGVPLRTPEGVAIGTLCVADARPRTLDDQQLFILKALARSVMAQLDLRRALAERDAERLRIEAAEAALRRLNGTLEAAVAERTRELDSVWRHSRDMLCVARFDGTFLRLNPAWAETLGWPPEALLDRPFIDLVHPDDRWRTTSAMAVLGDGLEVPGFENRYRHRDGSYRWFSWSAVPHEGLIYSIVRDVTAEKEAAAALAKAEDALRQSQKMEAVGQLTGGIAHDFNNLLTGITGALDLLQRRVAQGRVADVGRYVDIAVGSAERAAALTHRLLAFSRRQPLDPRPTDMNRLVRSMTDLMRRTIGESIAFDVALAEGLWATLCDPHQLENALLNLVINARDAMPEGGRLRIETANLRLDEDVPDGPEPGPYTALTVTDTGLGMEPEVAARAFDPFFTTKPMGRGTGLGLSMVYGFVRQSEGRVTIDTAPGRGTAVRIALPRFEGAPAPAVAAGGQAATPRAPAAETVLLVEDEPSVRDLVAEVLADLGYRALQAPDGPAALKVLEGSEPVDLLVTDVGLPGMNGRQLAEQGRRLRPGLRVLFITGYAEDAIFGEGHADPGLQMLTKPFSIEALAERVRAMIAAG